MTFITLTGADSLTKPEDLHLLSNLYDGIVEWGILFSESQNGVGRYPHKAWIYDFISYKEAQNDSKFKCALHVCGAAVKELLVGKGEISDLVMNFDRVQINFNAKLHNIDDIRATIQRLHNKEVITQFNRNNDGLYEHLKDLDNHAILFDASGGRGESPESWSKAIDNVKCGYAGGLGPNNLASELFIIHNLNGNNPYWVDMEGKIRDQNDIFDLNRATECLEIAKSHLLNINTPKSTSPSIS